MKKDIHPTYYQKVKIECACGHVFYAGSTKKEIKVETCSKCHPFFTGKKELLDIAKRADKFKKRTEKAKTIKKKK